MVHVNILFVTVEHGENKIEVIVQDNFIIIIIIIISVSLLFVYILGLNFVASFY